MKLIPEQITMLRKRREELLKKLAEYRANIGNREQVCLEEIGLPSFSDFDYYAKNNNDLIELRQINKALQTADVVTERNFDEIDIGTVFTAVFDEAGEDKEKLMLIDADTPNITLGQVSISSDLGKAVLGKKSGDKVNYTVCATGRKLSLSIESIDTIKENYESFITKLGRGSRRSKTFRRELSELRKINPEEYEKRFEITPSQTQIARDELERISNIPNNQALIQKRTYLRNVLDKVIKELPKDDSIGVGSIVKILLTDENGNVEEKEFEYINQAISTETSSQYVERISTLGHAIYGLREGDTFLVLRNRKKALRGIVVSVDNTMGKVRQKRK